MDQIKVCRIFEQGGFSQEAAAILVSELNQRDTESCTKGDLKMAIQALEIRLLDAINAQTWKLLGGFAVLGTLFKLADVWLVHR